MSYGSDGVTMFGCWTLINTEILTVQWMPGDARTYRVDTFHPAPTAGQQPQGGKPAPSM
jgi:hypothetical protein